MRSMSWLLKGAGSVALRASASALRVWRDCGGMPDGIDENFTIRLLAPPVNAEMRSSFVGHHTVATFELRAGVVKAEPAGSSAARALTNVEHSSTLIM